MREGREKIERVGSQVSGWTEEKCYVNSVHVYMIDETMGAKEKTMANFMNNIYAKTDVTEL